MKPFRSFLSHFGSLLLATSLVTSAGIAATPDPGQISISVGKLMEQGHFSRRKLDDSVSRQLLQNYLEALDYRRLFFTQQDIDAFTAQYGTSLDDDIMLGNTKPAVEIHALYKKRVEDRIAKVKEWIEKETFDFKSDRTVAINRQKAPWPKDEIEADQLWHDWLEYEFLQQKLLEKPAVAEAKGATSAPGKDAKEEKEPAVKAKTPKEVIERRYSQILRFMREETADDAVDKFLSCLAQTYDPHSEYMNAEEVANFAITMRLSLVGIGAVLQSDDGYAKITELVIGGPAQKEGSLQVGDRISGVAQGDKDFVDVIDMKLDKVVKMIRGNKSTKVRLQVSPAEASDPSARKIVEIVRDEVKLKDKEAKAELIEKPDAKGHTQRLGWITLPSFYADMENSGKKDATSTTADISTLLTRLKKEGISGLVIDLRNNGGGSLEEAVNFTNLFVKRGPVVQVKNTNGHIEVQRSANPAVAYDGPLIVLTNTLSASASEIVAGALQDYGRAVVVGDRHTFGKGTVQTILNIGRVIPFLGGSDGDAGALKLTIQKFYRVAGGSTQLRGVASDIVLPSIFDQDEIGEKALKGPLPYDVVESAKFEKSNTPLFINQLKERSTTRVAVDPEFKNVNENLTRLEKKIEENKISLNEKARRDEIAKDKARRKALLAARAKRKAPETKDYAITLDSVNKPELELVKYDASKDKDGAKVKKNVAEKSPLDLDDEEDEESKGPKVDPVRTETLNILTDLIDLSKKQITAATAPSPKL